MTDASHLVIKNLIIKVLFRNYKITKLILFINKNKKGGLKTKGQKWRQK